MDHGLQLDNGPQYIPSAEVTSEDVASLVALYLDDNEAYAQRFFPRMCRQKSAKFHQRMDKALWMRRRLVAIKVFRDGAKTARIRLFISKRIAYAYSHTILYIGKSEEKAQEIITWLKELVETNSEWAQFYGITIGKKADMGELELVNTIYKQTIRIKAVGIEGSIRGINFADYRPDLIIGDDIEDEKTTNTKELIRKHRELLYGTVMQSLASPMDNADAMLVLIQTPLDIEDAIETAFNNQGDDPWSEWVCVEASCFEVNEAGEVVSSWPEKFPLEFLLSQKRSYIKNNILSVWLREKEVTVTSSETCAFLLPWLHIHKSLPVAGSWKTLVLWVDPASSESDKADFQAVSIIGHHQSGSVWLISYTCTRGQDIDKSIDAFFDGWKLMLQIGKGAWLRFGVEQRSYQVQLKRALEKELKRRKLYAHVEDVKDARRSKEDVIKQAIRPVASSGQLNCLDTHLDFISDFSKYPQIKHDDLIESVARGIDILELDQSNFIEMGKVERVASSQATIIRSAKRLITGGGARLPFNLRPHQSRNHE